MAPDPILHERIYAGLKTELRSGRLQPGQHIDLQGVSDVYRASVTPVREAVCRLVGEGLVAFQRHGGFHVLPLEAAELRDLYDLNMTATLRAMQLCTDLALDEAVGSIFFPHERASAVEIAASASGLFSILGAAAGSAPLMRVIEGVSDRIAVPRIAEATILKDVRGELLTMNHGPPGDLRRTLQRRIVSYHRRRVAVVDRLLQYDPRNLAI